MAASIEPSAPITITQSHNTFITVAGFSIQTVRLQFSTPTIPVAQPTIFMWSFLSILWVTRRVTVRANEPFSSTKNGKATVSQSLRPARSKGFRHGREVSLSTKQPSLVR